MYTASLATSFTYVYGQHGTSFEELKYVDILLLISDQRGCFRQKELAECLPPVLWVTMMENGASNLSHEKLKIPPSVHNLATHPLISPGRQQH